MHFSFIIAVEIFIKSFSSTTNRNQFLTKCSKLERKKLNIIQNISIKKTK